MSWNSRPLFVELLVAPRSTLEVLSTRAPILLPALCLGVLSGLLQLWQTELVRPVLLTDPMLADLTDVAGDRSLAMLRGAAILLSAIGPAARAAALAFLLAACASCWTASATWRRLVSLLLHLEIVFWIESLATTILLWRLHPESIDDLRRIQLHAGLDAFLDHDSRLFRIAGAFDLFTLAWGTLLVLGLVRWMRPRLALSLALPLWSILVTLRQVVKSA